MMEVRRSESRFHARMDWLDTRYSFSFSDYYDPKNLQFGALRVFNEDVIDPGQGFPSHPHRDMEIVTCVLTGALSHRDSTGGTGVIRAGEIQAMTAGTGVIHSEFNASDRENAHLFQMWIMPRQRGLWPRYDQKNFRWKERPQNSLLTVVSADGHDGSLRIEQDAEMHLGRLTTGTSLFHHNSAGGRIYVHVIDGELCLDEEILRGGDAARIVGSEKIELLARASADVLIWDLP